MTIDELRQALMGRTVLTGEPGARHETIVGMGTATFGGVDVWTRSDDGTRHTLAMTKRRAEMLAERGTSRTRSGGLLRLETKRKD